MKISEIKKKERYAKTIMTFFLFNKHGYGLLNKLSEAIVLSEIEEDGVVFQTIVSQQGFFKKILFTQKCEIPPNLKNESAEPLVTEEGFQILVKHIRYANGVTESGCLRYIYNKISV